MTDDDFDYAAACVGAAAGTELGADQNAARNVLARGLPAD